MLSSLLIPLIIAGATSGGLPDPLEAGWRGEEVCELLHENEQVRALRCFFPPDGGHERHYHAPHFGYIIKGGTMRIADGSGMRNVKTETGATWWSDGVAWHEVTNIGGASAVYIILEPKGAAE